MTGAENPVEKPEWWQAMGQQQVFETIDEVVFPKLVESPVRPGFDPNTIASLIKCGVITFVRAKDDEAR